ncbi:MAG: hypothetical protein R3C14_02630 [Caldilineaceae bacterium]
MFQIIYEETVNWPENGSFIIKTPPLEGEIPVSPDSARRRANGYLARYVGLAMEAGDPALVWGQRPVWRMPIYLTLHGWGQVAKLGEIDVSALTREVFPLSHLQITEIQDRADAIAARLTSATS